MRFADNVGQSSQGSFFFGGTRKGRNGYGVSAQAQRIGYGIKLCAGTLHITKFSAAAVKAQD